MFSLKSSVQTSLLMSLVLSVVLFASVGFAQEEMAIDRSNPPALIGLEIRDSYDNVVNDFEIFARQAQVIRVVATYEGSFVGTLKIRYEDMPLFSDMPVGYEESHTESGVEVELVHEFMLQPGYSDVGNYDFNVSAYVDFTAHGPAPYVKIPTEVITVAVLHPGAEGCVDGAPVALDLPEFSGGPVDGLVVEVEYTPSCGAYFHTGNVSPMAVQAEKDNGNGSSDYSSYSFHNLTDGQRYEFTITSHYEDQSIFPLTSEPVFTTMDISPPGVVSASDIDVLALPGGHVQVTWNLVEDTVSGVDYYVLNRSNTALNDTVIVEIYAGFDDDDGAHVFVDIADTSSSNNLVDGEDYNYWVDVYDNVGNMSHGRLSATVMPDGVLPEVPSIVILNKIEFNDMDYIPLPEVEMRAISDGVELATADYMDFEVIRGSATQFGSEEYLNTYYFVATDIGIAGGGSAEHLQSIVPDIGSLMDVNDKFYHVRARARDEVGNYSAWSYESAEDTLVFAKADLFAPVSVSDISGEFVVVNDDHYEVELTWNIPSDGFGSGIASYLIQYRHISLESGIPDPENQWRAVTVNGVDVGELYDGNYTVVDSMFVGFGEIDIEGEAAFANQLEYIVVATDGVGHQTVIDSDVAVLEYIYRYAPEISAVCEDDCVGDVGDFPILGDMVNISWAGYLAPQVEFMEFTLRNINTGTVAVDLINVTGVTDANLSLLEDGYYQLSARPLFNDGFWGLHSSLPPITFISDQTDPMAVTTLTVTGTRDFFELNWTAPQDLIPLGYKVSFKETGSDDEFDHRFGSSVETFRNLPLSSALYQFKTYQSYDFMVTPYDARNQEQLIGNNIVSEVCLRSPYITAVNVVNAGQWEMAEIEWARPIPSVAVGHYKSIITIHYPGDIVPPFTVTLDDTQMDYTFDAVGQGGVYPGYYSVTVQEEAVDAQGQVFVTMSSEPELFRLDDIGPPMPTNLVTVFLSPEDYTDDEGYIISLQFDFDAREEDAMVRIIHGGDVVAPEVEVVTLEEGLHTYTVHLDNLKFSGDAFRYTERDDDQYSVKLEAIDVLDRVSPANEVPVSISAAHGVTPKVGGYPYGYYSEVPLVLEMDHVTQSMGDLSSHMRYQVEAARNENFDADALYSVIDWFSSASGENFTPYGEVECPQIVLRARASFCWDYSDPNQEVFFTTWSSNYDTDLYNHVLPNKLILLDAIAPNSIGSLRVSTATPVGSSAAAPDHGVVDISLEWNAIDDRADGNSVYSGMADGGYSIYRYLTGSPDYTTVLHTVSADSDIQLAHGIYQWTHSSDFFESEGNYRDYSYEVRAFDSMQNECAWNNDDRSADWVPRDPVITGISDDGESVAFSWESHNPNQVQVRFIVQRSRNRDHLGSEAVYEGGTLFSGVVHIEVPVATPDDPVYMDIPSIDFDLGSTVIFIHDDFLVNPTDDSPLFYHVKAEVLCEVDGVLELWEGPWSITERFPPSGYPGSKVLEIEDREEMKLVNFSLDQNFPNPFNPQTTIMFRVPRPSHVELRIYDVRGQLVNTLVDGTMETGINTVQWHGDDQAGRTVSTGIYFYKLVTPDETFLKRMVLMR